MFDSSFYFRQFLTTTQRGRLKRSDETTVLREFGGPEVLRYGQFQSQARAGEVVRLY